MAKSTAFMELAASLASLSSRAPLDPVFPRYKRATALWRGALEPANL